MPSWVLLIAYKPFDYICKHIKIIKMIYILFVTIIVSWLATKVFDLFRALARFSRPLSKEELDAYQGVVMITGGAAGIGLATAEFMALRGRDLFLIDYDAEQLKVAKNRLEQLCPKVRIFTEQMDLTTLVDPRAYQSFKQRVDSLKVAFVSIMPELPRKTSTNSCSIVTTI